jgi:3-hydroxyisobutyrate dehydrogenase-like beta-hydroxyacid dehydrogenase
MKRIGFVGVGVMGHGMASRLLQAGHPVTVIAHRNRNPIDDLVSKGAGEVSDCEQLARSSDVIVLCVSNSRAVEEVMTAVEPVLRPGMMVVDMGTSRPDSTRTLYRNLSELEVSFVESPVAGGVKQAAAGELGAFVGADAAAFETARPLLEAMCKTIHHFGPPGTGGTAKLLSNYLVFSMVAAVIEVFTKAREAGVDWSKLYDIAICGSGDSGVLRRMIGSAVEGDYRGYVFSVEGTLKDLKYFGEISQSSGGLSELGRAVTQVFEDAVAAGRGGDLLSELLAPDSGNRDT